MSITAKEFDERFEKEDISELLDFEKAKPIKELKKPPIKKINLDLPINILELIDKEANKIGVSRQALLKIWIAERLKEELSKPL